MFYCTIRNKAAVLRALKLCVGHELHLLRLLEKYRHMGQIIEGDIFLRLGISDNSINIVEFDCSNYYAKKKFYYEQHE